MPKKSEYYLELPKWWWEAVLRPGLWKVSLRELDTHDRFLIKDTIRLAYRYRCRIRGLRSSVRWRAQQDHCLFLETINPAQSAWNHRTPLEEAVEAPAIPLPVLHVSPPWPPVAEPPAPPAEHPLEPSGLRQVLAQALESRRLRQEAAKAGTEQPRLLLPDDRIPVDEDQRA